MPAKPEPLILERIIFLKQGYVGRWHVVSAGGARSLEAKLAALRDDDIDRRPRVARGDADQGLQQTSGELGHRLSGLEGSSGVRQRHVAHLSLSRIKYYSRAGRSSHYRERL